MIILLLHWKPGSTFGNSTDPSILPNQAKSCKIPQNLDRIRTNRAKLEKNWGPLEFKNILHCRNTGASDDPIMIVDSEVGDESVGVSINRINLYAFGGIGEMTKLKLTINPNGCQEGMLHFLLCISLFYFKTKVYFRYN